MTELIQTEFWVSPTGSDLAAGTGDAPFGSLQRGCDAVREARSRSKDAALTVVIEDGLYRLPAPLRLDAGHSGRPGRPVVFRAAPGARPVLSGAIRIAPESWSLHDPSLSIYRAPIGTSPVKSRQFYVNGRRAVRARAEGANGTLPAGFCPRPLVPASDDPFVVGGGIDFAVTAINPERWRDPCRWGNPKQVEAVIHTQWKMMSVPIESIAATSEGRGMITLQQPGWTNANVFYGSDGKPGIWSFWQVTRFENAYEFLDTPGEWWLNEASGWIYYIPRPGEDLATADAELPVLEVLVEGCGEPGHPISNLSFEGLTFSHATWLGPSGPNGYVSDQSGFHLVGHDHRPNLIGHDQHVVRTPGALQFKYADNITFSHNTFEHLGAVGLDFDTGSQNNTITDNVFKDISAAAIQLGGVGLVDHAPTDPWQLTRDNTISNNLVRETGREFVDAAGIFVGFVQNTRIEHNTIIDVPWSGIAIGWGWGLLDQSGFPGLPGATQGQWGRYDRPTPSNGNRIRCNRIERFLMDRWDGGAIYTTGQQGHSAAESDALLIEGNVALDKRDKAGGNTFYSDGGTRYAIVRGNVSLNNPIGFVDLGPPPNPADPLPYPAGPSGLNALRYGADSGGCRTYGDIRFEGNYWMQGPMPAEELAIGLGALLASGALDILRGAPVQPLDPYSAQGYFNVCPYTDGTATSYPVRMSYTANQEIAGPQDVPDAILCHAGVQSDGR